jgi:hypothetical protein
VVGESTRLRRASILLIGVCALALAGAAHAEAGWRSGGAGAGYSKAETMPAGRTPLASLAAGNVTVSWAAVALAGGGALDGYVVRRHGASGEEAAIGAGCAGTIAALSCTEAAVPPGSWRYTVTPVLQGWRGVESAESATVPVPLTIDTSAWDLRDASSGVERNASEPTAFAEDERSYATHSFAKAFAPNRYVEWVYDSPLAAGVTTSSVSFDFRFRAGTAGDVACFYFEVLGGGGGGIGTHGSTEPGTAASPWCTGSTYKLVSTPLPEVVSGDLANGLRIKLHGYESGGKSIAVDAATVSGTAAPSQAFTLHETALVDAANGKAETFPWALAAAGDGSLFTSESKWPSAFSGSRYLLLTFPSYVPGGDAVSGVSFVNSYRSAGNTVCWYFDVYAAGSLIGTHGSPAAPVSCTSSTTSFVTDSVALPEVTTAAQADDLAIKMYVDNAGSRRSEHDLAQLRIGYVP